MTTPDQIEKLCGSRIQHGRLNDRIYVMHLNPETVDALIPRLDHLASEKNYGKITAKIPENHWPAFRSAGYTMEARVPGFFDGRVDGLFIGKFLSARRMAPCETPPKPDPETLASSPSTRTDDIAPVTPCTHLDADALGRIYREAFASYPFPIHDPDFLHKVMDGNTFYYCIHVRHRLVAAAAAETDPKSRSCEMTDFATRPEFRGRGFAASLLDRLHQFARRRNLKTAYTIARADSPAMNRVFKKRGYDFAGRLINNTHIDGRIRSMNVWYRRL